MEDTLISAETAQLAKEKGFNHFHSKSLLGDMNLATQSLLQKWLRDVHHIDIELIKLLNKWTDRNMKMPLFNTYEEALEESLQYALMLIDQE